MLLRYLISLLMFTLIASFAYPQKIQGIIIDGNNKPIQFVSIVLKTDSNILSYQLSDSTGRFQFSSIKPSPNYSLKFSAVGYRTVDTVFSNINSQNLKITMPSDSRQLQEVDITSHKNIIERKIDRLVFNVGNNINTIGLNGIDLLSKTPLVRVDGDEIKLVGKEDLAVMIDGRLTHVSGQALANLLRSMNADDISQIEVITNPPSQYDAAGNSGMINIITKKSKVPGYYAVVSERDNIDKYFTSSPDIGLNYNVGNLRTFGGIGISNGANGPTSQSVRYYQQQTWYRNDLVKETSQYVTGNIGFEYLLSKSVTIGGSYNNSYSYPNMSGSTRTIIEDNTTRKVDSILNSDFFNKKRFISNTFNFYASDKLDTLGKMLEFNWDYFSNTSDIHNSSLNANYLDNGDITNSPVNDVRSNDDLLSHGTTMNLQLDLPLKKINFTFGAKASFVRSNSNITSSLSGEPSIQSDSAVIDQFVYDENIQALYGSLNTKFGKFELQAGIRGEFTQTNGLSVAFDEDNRQAYFNLFPTFYLTYQANKNDIISFNFGRRISRPFFSSLDPFPVYQDAYDYRVGNPKLQPSYTNNFELSNTLYHLVNTTLSYGITHGEATTVEQISNGSNIQVSTLGNFLSTQNLLFDNSISTQILRMMQTTDELSVYYSTTISSSSITEPHSSGWGADFSTSNSISINKSGTIKSGMDFTYQFPFVADITHFYHYCYMDLSLSGLFMRKKLQVTLSARDIFKDKNVRSFTEYNGIAYFSTSNNDSQRLIISLKYSFGNAKLNKGKSHTSSTNEQVRSGH